MKIFYVVLASLCFTLLSCRKELHIVRHDEVNPMAFHNRIIGSSASELLDDQQFRSLIIEIQYLKGFRPNNGTIDHLKTFLETYINKPGGIFVSLKEIASSNVPEDLSMEDVSSIERNFRKRFVKHDTISLYLLFTNGVHPGNKILGMAYRNTSAVIYGKSIRKYSKLAGRLTHQELETAVVLHEIGHLLGLVNKGTALTSEHNDSDFDDHCNNKKCLMYHSVETKNLPSILVKGNVPILDANCIKDLVGNGGKNIPDYRPFVKPFRPAY